MTCVSRGAKLRATWWENGISGGCQENAWEREEFGEKPFLKAGSTRKRRRRERIYSLFSLVWLPTLGSRSGNEARGCLGPEASCYRNIDFIGGHMSMCVGVCWILISRRLDEACGSRESRDLWRCNEEAQYRDFLVRQMDTWMGLDGAWILEGAVKLMKDFSSHLGYVAPVNLFSSRVSYSGWNVHWGMLGRAKRHGVYQEVF